MIQYSEKKLIQGNLEVTVIDVATGKVVDHFSEHNLVVTLGKVNMAKLLGGDAAGKPITKVGVGTSGIIPTLSDTGLTNAFIKDIGSVSYNSSGMVTFSFEISDSEANGLTIQEFGLYDDDNNLFARKTRASIVKTSANMLLGIWKINIA